MGRAVTVCKSGGMTGWEKAFLASTLPLGTVVIFVICILGRSWYAQYLRKKAVLNAMQTHYRLQPEEVRMAKMLLKSWDSWYALGYASESDGIWRFCKYKPEVLYLCLRRRISNRPGIPEALYQVWGWPVSWECNTWFNTDCTFHQCRRSSCVKERLKLVLQRSGLRVYPADTFVELAEYDGRAGSTRFHINADIA